MLTRPAAGGSLLPVGRHLGSICAVPARPSLSNRRRLSLRVRGGIAAACFEGTNQKAERGRGRRPRPRAARGARDLRALVRQPGAARLPPPGVSACPRLSSH